MCSLSFRVQMDGQSTCAVEVEAVTRRFGDVTALDQVTLSISEGEFFSLLGPSGCGKTTLLRIIAGLETPDSGRVRLAGLDASELPAHRRPVNTVFQSYALFPHLNVWDNVAFGLRMKKVPQSELEQRVKSVVSLVELEGLMKRRPSQLSGGQKQRVALARAIVNEPKVLLLDEPLAALDVQLRKQLQLELRSLQQRLGMTFVYVTHDQEEAMVLSDRVAVMKDGRLVQIGSPQQLYEHPCTRFCSQFLGSCVLLQGEVVRRDADSVVVQTVLGELRVRGQPPEKLRVTLAIRPERVELRRTDSAGRENEFPARVERVIYAGAETHYELKIGDQVLRAEIMNIRNGSPVFVAGQDAVAYLPAAALIILDD
jgi:spermidine/putrescine transport system ATP-binding protein